MGQEGVTPVGTSGQVLKLVAAPDDGVDFEFGAALSSENEVPPSGTGATGEATVGVELTRSRVCLDLEADGLAGEVVAGHLHRAPAGENGPVVVDFGVDQASFQTCLRGLDPNLVADIVRNPSDYYVNIHTTAVRSGEIRGQLER